MSNLILGYGLLGKEIHKQTGWEYLHEDDKWYYYHQGYQDSIPKETDIVINCMGYTNTLDDDRHKHWRNNVDIVKTLIDYCNHYQIKLIHISTDYIYSESEINATEKSVPIHNNCWYSYSKLAADSLVQITSNRYLICRGTHKATPFINDMAWIDQVGNFDYVDVIAGLIIKLINKGASGVYNVGTEKKTMYDLAKRTKPDVLPCRRIEGAPANISMNIDKLKNFLK